MDTSVMEAGDDCQCGHCNRCSKYIDLISDNGKTSSEKCEHFSIRGFVSEVRKKDWKMCWPFTLDGDINYHEEKTCLLPPLHVPTFKFWRCENCLQQLEARCITKKPRPGLKLHSSELKSSKSCTHTSAFSGAIQLLSNCQPGTKPDRPAGKFLDGNASCNLNAQITEYQPLLCMELKEKMSNAIRSPKGIGMRSKAQRGQEISVLKTVSIEATSSKKQKACFTDKKAPPAPKQRGRDMTFKSGYATTEVGDATLAVKQKRNKNTFITCGARKEDSAYQHSKEPTAAVTSGEAEDCEWNADHMGRSLMDGHPSVGINARDNDTSSTHVKALIRSDVEDFSNDDSSGLPRRRRTRKVRLLTELLCENGDGSVATNSKSQDSQMHEVSDVSAGVEKLPLLDSLPGTYKRGLGHGKKRKPSRDENGRPAEISFTNKAHKNNKMTTKDMEEPNATVNTEDIELAFARMKLHSGKKKHLIKKKVPRSPFSIKKKTQKTWSFGDILPAPALSQDIILKVTRDKSGYPSTSDVIIASVSNECKTREMDLFPLSARTMKPEHSIDKMKSKSHEVINPRTSQLVWNGTTYGEGPMARKDRDFSCSGSASHHFPLASDAPLDNALNLCLNSYMPLPKNDSKCHPQLPEKRNALKDSVVRKASEMKFFENFGKVPRATSIACSGRTDVLSSKKPDTNSIAYLIEKQNYASPVQIVNCSLHQKQELCGASGQGKSSGVHDSVILLKGGNYVTAGKVSERGAVDFPMEVVELMAKNQYERCLPDSEYNKRQVESPICTKNVQMIDFGKVHSDRELIFSKQEAAQKQMFQARSARSGPNVGSTIQNPIDFFMQADRNKDRMDQQKQALPPVGFRPFILEHHEKPSGGLQHPHSSSSKQYSARARKWIEDVTWKMPTCTGYTNAKLCNTCQGIPQQNTEPKQHWSSLATNQSKIVYNNMSQHGAGPSTNVLAGCPECSRKIDTNSIWDLKSLSQNTPNLGMQTRNLVSEIPGGTRLDDPFNCHHKGTEANKKHMASSDLYSNEAIPAMHLLSLMDAGLSSSAPVIGNHRFPKRPPFAPPKKASGACGTSNTMKMPPYGQNQHAGSHEPIPGVPNTFDVSACSYQNDRSIKRIANFASQTSQVKEKRKGTHLCLSNSIPKLQTSASASVPFGANCGSTPVHSMQAIFSAPSHPKAIPSQPHPPRNLKHKLDINSVVLPVTPHKSSTKIEVCTINRNPAEFTIPEAGNVYMIAGENLKFELSVPAAKGTSVAKQGRKRRSKKLVTGKEKAQPSPS